MVETNELEKVIQAYGEVLEKLSKDKDARLLMSESKLPYPKEVIRTALKAAIELTDDENMREQLKAGLLFIDDFAPDKEVPRDFIENLKRWAIKQIG